MPIRRVGAKALRNYRKRLYICAMQNAINMTTIKIDNNEFKGEFIPFYNNTGFNFKLENGELLTGLFKQGYSGQKEIELVLSFDFKKRFMRTVNNSNRQVKDPNAYFLRFK